MLLKPKKFKNYKVKKNRLHGLNYNSKNLTKGSYGLKALDYTRLTSKSIASRMGKGKGDIKNWVCLIKPGKILFEISDISEDIAYKALAYGASKLTINCKIVKFKKFQ